MYELKLLSYLVTLLGGFAMLYVIVSYLRHNRLPRNSQVVMAMVLGMCLLGLAATGAGVYMLVSMNATTWLTALMVGLPMLICLSLGVVALFHMRQTRKPRIYTLKNIPTNRTIH